MKRKFFYHYNKPKSRQRGKPTISLHYRDQCHYLDGLDVRVPTQSRVRTRQPFFVMEGRAESITFDGGSATIK